MSEYPHTPGEAMVVRTPARKLLIEAQEGLTTGTAHPVEKYTSHADVLAAHPDAYDAWEAGGTYNEGEQWKHDGTVYRCLQSHTNFDPSHTPDVTTSLWTPARLPDVLAAWEQPTAENPYNMGARVTHPDKENTMGTGAGTIWIWESKINTNVTEPGQDGQFHRYWEPIEQA